MGMVFVAASSAWAGSAVSAFGEGIAAQPQKNNNGSQMTRLSRRESQYVEPSMEHLLILWPAPQSAAAYLYLPPTMLAWTSAPAPNIRPRYLISHACNSLPENLPCRKGWRARQTRRYYRDVTIP